MMQKTIYLHVMAVILPVTEQIVPVLLQLLIMIGIRGISPKSKLIPIIYYQLLEKKLKWRRHKRLFK